MLTVKFDDRQFQNGLNALLSRVEDTRGLLDAVGQEAAKQMSENFVNAGVGGVLWEPNKPATLAKKKGRRPLTNTGDLMNITHKVADDGKPSLQMAYDVILDGRDYRQFANPQTFLYQLEKTYGLTAIFASRESEAVYKQTYGGYVRNANEGILPCECWVGDAMEFDSRTA